MARTGRLRNAAMIGMAVIAMAGTAGWARPAAARADQAVPPGEGSDGLDEVTATAPPAGTRPSSRLDDPGSGTVGHLPGTGSDGLPVATGALAAAAVGAAVVAVRRSPSRR